MTLHDSRTFRNLEDSLLEPVLAQKREDFDAMRAYQAMMAADLQQYNLAIQNAAIGAGSILLSIASAKLSHLVSFIATAVIVACISVLTNTLLLAFFSVYKKKIVRDCEVYVGHRDRYLTCMKLLGLYEPHDTVIYGSISPCKDGVFSSNSGKGTQFTLDLMKISAILYAAFIVVASTIVGCIAP